MVGTKHGFDAGARNVRDKIEAIIEARGLTGVDAARLRETAEAAISEADTSTQKIEAFFDQVIAFGNTLMRDDATIAGSPFEDWSSDDLMAFTFATVSMAGDPTLYETFSNLVVPPVWAVLAPVIRLLIEVGWISGSLYPAQPPAART